jgi:hypothetical protein
LNVASNGINDRTPHLPSELFLLPNLRALRLANNSISGSVPTEIGLLSELVDLQLGGLLDLLVPNNKLTGQIPSELGGISTLQYLNLQYNALNGTLPTELGRLQGLLTLDIDYNELSGSLPSQLGNLSSLNHLDLGINKLTGRIPSELGGLSTVQYLNLGSNALTGTLPTELGSLSSIIYLDLLDNTWSGVIPTEVVEIPTLHALFLPTRMILFDKFVKKYNVSIHALQDASSPQYLALAWMVDNDSTDLQSTLSDDELVERFALIHLYFATGGASWLDQAGFLTPLLNTCYWNSIAVDSFGETRGLGAGCNDEGSVVTLDLCKFPKISSDSL